MLGDDLAGPHRLPLGEDSPSFGKSCSHPAILAEEQKGFFSVNRTQVGLHPQQQVSFYIPLLTLLFSPGPALFQFRLLPGITVLFRDVSFLYMESLSYSVLMKRTSTKY